MPASAPRTLSERRLNRAVLARQLLLERADLPIPRALERVGGIQAQYAPSMYIGLWSRLARFERDNLTRALERRDVVQGTLMRATIHLVSRRDYWPLALAIREGRRAAWLRATRGRATPEALAGGAARLRDRLRDGPMRARDVAELLGTPVASGVGLWLDLVRVPPSGTWERRRADLLAAAEDWVGPPPAGLTHDDAVDHLVRRYLGAFGPATRKDVASWTGLTPATLAGAVDRVAPRRFRTEAGEELVDLARAPLPGPEAPTPPRFLPTWDANLLVHARRAGILPEAYRPLVFSVRNPQSVATFTVDGAVAGAWRHADGVIRRDPFGPVPPDAAEALADEGGRLAELLA